MRLIDAENLKYEKVLSANGNGVYRETNILYESQIDTIKTVEAIPIDKPFLKMRYGDYVVYNKKWLVDHLQTEWNILQGKEYQPSIPVEWIKKWCNKEHNRKSLEERLLKRYGVITMLEDWEKENEKS